MAFEELLARIGLGELVAEDFFLAQVLMMSAATILFLASLVMCVMAFRAAGAARKARSEAEAHFLSAKDIAVEMRHLTAQVELSTKRLAASPVRSEPVEAASEKPVLPGSETNIDADRASSSDAANDSAPLEDKTLSAAREAASVPKSLVGSLLRRKR